MSVSENISIHMYTYVCTCVYAYMCAFVHTYAYIHVCMYLYIQLVCLYSQNVPNMKDLFTKLIYKENNKQYQCIVFFSALHKTDFEKQNDI